MIMFEYVLPYTKSFAYAYNDFTVRKTICLR